MATGGALPTVDWRRWTSEDWNDALFRYFFVATTASVEPVSRLLLTDDELARAISSSDATPRGARDAFLRAVRCTPAGFRQHLSSHRLENGEWRRQSIPSFVVWLLVTCYAASSGDSETINEGDFRHRLRLLLGHPPNATYPLDQLAQLWLVLQNWLRSRRRAGEPYRTLVLPDPGHMSRIGYSIRLAFPPWRDRAKLVRLLGEHELTGQVPMRDALELLSTHIERGRFSRAFCEAFESARTLFLSRRQGPDLDVLWSTICEAAVLAEPLPSGREQRIRYQLFLEVADDFRCQLVVAATAQPRHSTSFRFSQADVVFGPYRFIASEAQGKGTSAATLILENAATTRLAEFQQSAARLAIVQGVLLFRQNDDGHWELAPIRPDEGRVRCLIRRNLFDRFRRAMGTPDLTAQDSIYVGWMEVGAFDAARLDRLDVMGHTSLEEVRCLQRTSTGTRVRVSDGVSIESGYLGLEGLLPTVVVGGADSVKLYSREPGHVASIVAALVRNETAGSVFRFPKGVGDLEGPFTLVAARAGQELAARAVVFRSRVLSQAHLAPTDPDRWIVEAAGPDVAHADSTVRAQWVDSSSPESLSELPRLVTRRDKNTVSEFAVSAASIDSDDRLDRFVEAMAAISAVRRGIPEGDFLSTLRSVLQLADEGMQWDVARAWVEAGYFDVLSRRHWRGRVYFAVDPRLVLVTREGKQIVSLVGLSAYGLRGRVDAAVRARGGVPVLGYSCCPYISPPGQWFIPSVAAMGELSTELGLPPLARVKDIPSLAWPISRICSDPREPFGHYEVRGSWDWRESRFATSSHNIQGVRLTWLSRLDRPDCFLVEGDATPPWRTFSRNWAFLVAHMRSGSRPYRRIGESALARAPESRAYLPVPVARAVVLNSGVASGPVTTAAGQKTYVYQCRDVVDRSQVESTLWDQPREIEVTARVEHLVRFIANQTNAPSNPSVVLPSDLRRVLLATNHRVARDLATRPVAAHLVGHIRRLCKLVRS